MSLKEELYEKHRLTCYKKRSYMYREDAETVLKRIMIGKDNSEITEVYRCFCCYQYHIGRRNKRKI